MALYVTIEDYYSIVVATPQYQRGVAKASGYPKSADLEAGTVYPT